MSKSRRRLRHRTEGERSHMIDHVNYGAFVLDPDGKNIEAVTHRPQP